MLLSLILSILISSVFSAQQQAEIKLQQEININAKSFTVDPLGYLYVINGTELKKIDLKTNKEKNFSTALSGKIHSIDVSDPFRTLVFYKDFNRIEWLDKNLSSIVSSISLDDLGYYQVAAVCQSVNGGFWLFDQSLHQIVYIDKNLKTVNKSAQLSEMIDQNSDTDQIYMLEKNDYIYLGINSKEILLFDSYGTYIKTFPLNYKEKFQVNNGTIIYYNGESLNFYNTSSYTEEKITLQEQNTEQLIFENKRIFIQTKEKITIYQPINF